MNDPTGKDAAAVRIFPPAAPLVTILAGVGLQHVWPIHVGVEWPGASRWIVGALLVLGPLLFLGLWSVLAVRHSGQSENPWKPTTQLVTSGPFKITRNPMYLQMVLICVGFAVMLMNAWILLLTPLCAWALYTFAIRPEEEYLEAKFGQHYRTYKARVRRWI